MMTSTLPTPKVHSAWKDRHQCGAPFRARGPACAPNQLRPFSSPEKVLGRRAATASQSPSQAAPGTANQHLLLNWMKENGAPEQQVEIRSLDLPGAGRPLDLVVARNNIAAGQVAVSVPERMVVTLDRVFECEFVAELLTTDKLSELACLTLYMMYEKKVGASSFWAPFIKELDRQRARGAQAVESPLLWDDKELEELLQGSPLVPAVRQRLAGIREEYEALDTVWFMASSLFNKYPFDIPTEAFSFERFKQAFAAVQASIVHLQGVPIAKRFALVPLGPPLMSYSSTSRGMLVYNEESRSVQLIADRDYSPGEPLTAWCGPQPNSRLLLNYGLVDENNPYDKLQMTVTIPNTDRLFQAKRAALQPHGLSTQATFDLARNRPLPPALIPFMRLALATTSEQVLQVWFPPPAAAGGRGPPPGVMGGSGGPPPGVAGARGGAPPSSSSGSSGGPGAVSPPQFGKPSTPEVEKAIATLLSAYFQKRLDSYKHPLWHDIEVVGDATSTPRQKIAARLTKIEKSILLGCMEELKAYAGGALPAAEEAAAALAASSVKFSP